MLQLKWRNVYDFDRKHYAKHIVVQEGKTGKETRIAINNNLIDAFEMYMGSLKSVSGNDYIFTGKTKGTHLSRSQAFRIITHVAEALNMENGISCHSLRKTFGYYAWKYGTPPAGNANFAWLQHMIYHLNPTGGQIGMVLANGSLSSQSGGEGEIRKNIINADLVECIIAMPTQLFYTTQIPVSLWFINNHKKQTEKTLFIDARKMGTMVSRKLRELTEEDIKNWTKK